ncbi:alpha/beta hydrolase [Nonomuraea maheshkhaliensis]|uniref:Alpha/beta hydrolase n=1 Tax=Nonomuraea maheshkhaliensis TaxID=419590 RepID=A0ABP4QUF2_9ACTN
MNGSLRVHGATLRVCGATLHHEVRGEGPPLLLIPGGTGGAASLEAVAADLAAEYTVVTYDPRGLGRSPLDDPEAEQRVAEHADDALRLLDLLAPGEPARVFGSSSGAIVALHLLTAHQERLERVVAHEPPVVEVLPDAAVHRALVARVRETFRTEGLMPAMAVFAAGLSKDGEQADRKDGESADRKDGEPANPPSEPPEPPEPPEPAELRLAQQAAARPEQTMAGLPFFVGRIVPGFMSYVPDVDRLAALSDRLVLAAGQDSRGELPYRPAAYLAERFGAELVHFPGGHTGLTTHPVAFAELLRKILRA